ncbi:MAG: hypothetical protein HETSPECPRED_009294 [Heterodermia speciosa]|uniref:Uncharacterized protein n=1 Tax=Heterodermia speciosa TaxID=116794 RepID=A0A8H3G0W3_9LECA|nr:MAG: hypothetical protein HETSPECPRED_009294 [Heterodermia speciosa]
MTLESLFPSQNNVFLPSTPLSPKRLLLRYVVKSLRSQADRKPPPLRYPIYPLLIKSHRIARTYLNKTAQPEDPTPKMLQSTIQLLLLTLTLHLSSASSSPPSTNQTCLPTLHDLPLPNTPSRNLPHGIYILPQKGMTILGDTCMIFCANTPNTALPHPSDASHPAIRPTSSTILTDTLTSSHSSSPTTTSTTSTHTSTSLEPLKVTSTSHMTKIVNPSYTKYIVGGEHPSTKWVIGGAHPTTLPPGTLPSFAASKRDEPAPPPSTLVASGHTQSQSLPPTTPPNVLLRDRSCVTLCPNKALDATFSIPSSSTSTAIGDSEGDKKRPLPPAFIALAIVLPLLTSVTALVAGAMLLSYRRTVKALRNERNRGIEMGAGEGFFRGTR